MLSISEIILKEFVDTPQNKQCGKLCLAVQSNEQPAMLLHICSASSFFGLGFLGGREEEWKNKYKKQSR